MWKPTYRITLTLATALLALLSALLLSPTPSSAYAPPAVEPAAAPPPTPTTPVTPTIPPPQGFICTPGRVSRWRESCLERGPGTTAYRMTHIRLPDPLPELPLIQLTPDPHEDVVPFTFAYVNTLPLSIYRHPIEAAMGMAPVRILYSGDQWVSIDAEVDYEGNLWYQINDGEFVPARYLSIASPSRFQGVYLNQQPEYAFAWINRSVQPSLTPQGPANTAVPLYYRYTLVTIYAEEFRATDELWYLIGPDQWVEQEFISKVTVDPRPAEVAPGEQWIEVDLFEQTLAAYEGDRMVYATLISSGRSGSTFTDSGLFRIWMKLRAGKMSNPDTQDGSPAWYYLEDVPWTMYFNGPTALHTAYWHDAFGFTRSHGCVNLAPRDAKWLFNWTTPYLPPDQDALLATGTWIWVHNTSPFGE
ncbi:MAG: L,D-transpeptidase [Anaerolineae bacterium]|nr:L,D-transpeptidase [Anaerolineae bacterium]